MSLQTDTDYGMTLLGKMGVLNRSETAQLGTLAELLLRWDERDGGGEALPGLVEQARAKLSEWIQQQADYERLRTDIAAAFVPFRPQAPTGVHQERAKTLLCTGEPIPQDNHRRRAVIVDALARWLWSERRSLSEQARFSGDRQSAYTLYRFTHHDAWRVAEIAVDLETQSRRKKA